MGESRTPGHIAPWQGVLLYLVLGVAWVWLGDALLERWVQDPHQLTVYQTWKGWAYVLVTCVLAGWLLWRRERAEQQRLALSQELTQIVRHAPVGMARVSTDGQILWANEQLCRMLGATLPQLLKLSFRDVVRAHHPGEASQQLSRLVAGEIDHYLGERDAVRCDDGRLVPVLTTVTYIRAGDGQNAYLACAVQDLGEIQAARQALERSEMRLRLALDGSGAGMWERDLRSLQTLYSPGVVQMLRYPGPDLPRDFVVRDRLHPEDRERVILALRRAIDDGEPFSENARLLCFDGQYRWFLARGVRHLDAAGQPERFSGMLTDLTAQRLMDERQRLAATVMDYTIEAVLVTDAQSRILSVNPAFTRLMGYSEQELLGQTPRVFKSGRHGPDFYQALWQAVHTEGHWRGEIWNRRKNGEIFPEHMSLSAVRDHAGEVTHYVCMFTDISEEKAQRQRLEYLAHHDALTGLNNRLWFGEQLHSAVAQAQARGERMAVLQLNLDRFKDVNDSYGHTIGDFVLQHIARQVTSAMREGDALGRMAGDEIAVLVRHLQHHDEAAEVARRLIAAVGVPWRSPDGLEVVVGVSVGISLFPDHADSAQLLLQGAHAAVYGAKALGRGAWCFYEESMTHAARERLALQARLRTALALGHLQVHYQPQIDIASDRIVGAEALVRWQDPSEGMISPARFIPVAEASGIIGPLGEWVLREVCRQGQAWRTEGLPPLTLAVNVSPRQFHLTDLVRSVSAALADSGWDATRLELEITESALAERTEDALLVLNKLRALGVRLAIDDFGTGYSSLAQLKRFPIQVLKIDQGFIRDIPRSADDLAISSAIIAMGHSLGMQVLAEGVETAEQLAFLRERACDQFQGYLCSRPLPAADFAALLRRQPALPAP